MNRTKIHFNYKNTNPISLGTLLGGRQNRRWRRQWPNHLHLLRRRLLRQRRRRGGRHLIAQRGRLIMQLQMPEEFQLRRARRGAYFTRETRVRLDFDHFGDVHWFGFDCHSFRRRVLLLLLQQLLLLQLMPFVKHLCHWMTVANAFLVRQSGR